MLCCVVHSVVIVVARAQQDLTRLRNSRYDTDADTIEHARANTCILVHQLFGIQLLLALPAAASVCKAVIA
jgi:hypothetical protein